MSTLHWPNLANIPSQSYTCGHCGKPIASDKGWHASFQGQPHPVAFICLCHFCTLPTFIDVNKSQHPGVMFGNPVQDVQDLSVSKLYDEARKCMGAGAYTAAILCSRKLLMHIAVSKGATAGETFLSYVEYLANNHYVPPDAKEWVDHIRTKSNEANHEIAIMGKEDAEELISFIEMLMKVIFEFPAAIKKKKGGKP